MNPHTVEPMCVVNITNRLVYKRKYGSIHSNMSLSTKLFNYVLDQDIEGVRRELESNDSIAYANKGGARRLYCYCETPLEVAVQMNSYEIAELLILAGADVNVAYGPALWTPLHVATYSGKCDMMSMLIECGANIEAQDIQGATPLFKAYGNGLEMLLEEGANVHAVNHMGITPLMMAACACKVDVVKMLLSYEADVDTKDNRGFESLAYAVRAADVKIVEMLLAHNADVDAKDNQGLTPLIHLACMYGTPIQHQRPHRRQLVIAEMLLKNGADIFAKAFDGRTALGASHGDLKKLLQLEMDNLKFTAFAMSSNDRLGEGSQAAKLHEEMLRMVWVNVK